jgi:Spy/CpxP family protein refolding chaperone
MFLRTKFTIAGLIVGLATCGSVALAQQPQPNNQAAGVQQQGPAGMKRRAMRRRARMGMFLALRQLNLTDQQRQQARTIMQANFQNTQAQRQELRQLMQQRRAGTLDAAGQARARELRGQLLEGRKAVRTQLTGLLTPEQKAKLEEMIKARRANHSPLGRRNQTPE